MAAVRPHFRGRDNQEVVQRSAESRTLLAAVEGEGAGGEMGGLHPATGARELGCTWPSKIRAQASSFKDESSADCRVEDSSHTDAA